MSALTESLQKAQNGDKNAFSDIVRQYQGRVSGMVFAHIGDFHRSEEITQETFLTAWQELPKLQQREQFSAWICTIARNLAKKSYRPKQAKIDAAVSQFSNGSITEHAIAATPETEAIRHEQSQIVWNAVAEMPESQREAIILFYRSGNSIHEIAEATGASEDAIRQRLVRARSTLREKLESVLDDIITTTSPGEPFTLAVMAALPAAAMLLATNTALATGTTTGGAVLGVGGITGGKTSVTGGLSLFWIYLFPAAYFGWMVSMLGFQFIASSRNAPTLRSRRFRVYSIFWATQYYFLAFIVLGGSGVAIAAWTVSKLGAPPFYVPFHLVILPILLLVVVSVARSYRQKMRNLLKNDIGLPAPPVESYSYPQVERRFHLALFTNILLAEAFLAFFVAALWADAVQGRNNNPLIFFGFPAAVVGVSAILGGIFYTLGRYLLSICRSKESYLAAMPVVNDPFLVAFGLSNKNTISIDRTKQAGKLFGIHVIFLRTTWGLCLGMSVWFFSFFSWEQHPVGLGLCAGYLAMGCLAVALMQRNAKTERTKMKGGLAMGFLILSTIIFLNWVEFQDYSCRFLWCPPSEPVVAKIREQSEQRQQQMTDYVMRRQELSQELGRLQAKLHEEMGPQSMSEPTRQATEVEANIREDLRQIKLRLNEILLEPISTSTELKKPLQTQMIRGMSQTMIFMAFFVLLAQCIFLGHRGKPTRSDETELCEAIARFRPEDMPDDAVPSELQPFPRRWKILLFAIFVLIILAACCVCFVYV